MEIAPVSLAQVAAGRDGRQYEISGEAGRIVQRLQEIDPSLRVVFNEGGMFFAVQQVVDAGLNATAVEDDATQRKCVMRVPMDEWDDRVVHEWEMRAHELRHGISAAARLDALDAKRRADVDYAFEQEVKERAYPLFRSFQRNLLGQNPRAFIAGRKAA